ncbi:MAG TPA: isoprenylcysteine carboxylmethyltransferase family protein [Candidatus Acidoferrales bacterium]|nr:isoprenylcysteine carboxylmethyltransferase family protein [Candidatus Acidoferrales bacterium]
MTANSVLLSITRAVIILCWLAFSLPLFARRPFGGAKSIRSAPASRLGIALQGLGFFLLWFFNIKAVPWAAFQVGGPVLWTLCPAAMLLAIASVWMAVAAIRALGKQWSYQARLIEGHRLVVEGPYSHVRNPIYTGMLGMMLATGIAFSVWWALSAAVVLYAAGTAIRVRAEERLLHEAFGEDFEAYCRYVPAVIPRWKT